MPVSEVCLTRQSKRLIKLPFGPTGEEESRALIDEFKRVLRPRVLTDAHCAAVIDYLMEHAMRCPPPAEVVNATETVEAPDAVKAPMGCEECRGSGFVGFEKYAPRAGYVADYADFCACQLGEFKRACDAERKSKEAERKRR